MPPKNSQNLPVPQVASLLHFLAGRLMDLNLSVTLTSIKQELIVAGLWDGRLDTYQNTRKLEKQLEDSKPVNIYTHQSVTVEKQMAKEGKNQFQLREELMRKVRGNFGGRTISSGILQRNAPRGPITQLACKCYICCQKMH